MGLCGCNLYVAPFEAAPVAARPFQRSGLLYSRCCQMWCQSKRRQASGWQAGLRVAWPAKLDVPQPNSSKPIP